MGEAVTLTGIPRGAADPLERDVLYQVKRPCAFSGGAGRAGELERARRRPAGRLPRVHGPLQPPPAGKCAGPSVAGSESSAISPGGTNRSWRYGRRLGDPRDVADQGRFLLWCSASSTNPAMLGPFGGASIDAVSSSMDLALRKGSSVGEKFLGVGGAAVGLGARAAGARQQTTGRLTAALGGDLGDRRRATRPTPSRSKRPSATKKPPRRDRHRDDGRTRCRSSRRSCTTRPRP